ncbi:Nucleoside-diphosphate-sugar epimerase [Geoalkalibacter ferrihydriticus]|uniref:NAD-dependent epimerase/dehydratase domain-containing protein n=2 Tax=Geoalkalibacter ferrihydriticus TaxID=392333 RepID=A0A0C2EB85_9BACT|nr:NAD-dependent epimerase/dehydratase family protein [Geoalkalibacter ferrihydriticus]KIH75863.1 hypothetical protein GFER_14905 [Geoalkalibacter ferrihydriticus DSM 17813]SDM85943.1 Nucleoside-diphosphate-sugar epimerase [Geoalkalibacter ferrihydriticus]
MTPVRKILVTGAAGFIGQHLVKLLLDEGQSVVAVVRDATRLKNFSGLPRLEILAGDLEEPETIGRLPENVDGVVHLAALLGDSGRDEAQMIAANVTSTERLLAWFSQSPARGFVLLSTPGVQGLGHREAPESAPCNPHGVYERTKMHAEQVIRSHPFRGDQRWTILRPDFVYGPGDLRRIRLYRQIARRHWVRIGSGTAVVRPTYVSDVCRAIASCLYHPRAANETFNIAGPELLTIDQYVDTIADLLGVKLWPLRLPTPLFHAAAPLLAWSARRSGKTPLFTRSQVDFLTCDHGTCIRHIQAMLGFEPQVAFREGMARTLAWARRAGHLPTGGGA